MLKKWFVYILECGDGSFYTGISKNIEKRFEYHRQGNGSYHVKVLKPKQITWKEEHCDISSARKREIQLKRWTRRKKLALISGNFALLKKL